MSPYLRLAATAALVATLAACGSTTGDRALSAALIGGGGGAVVGAVAGNPLAGAAVGGAAGAVVGAVATPRDIDLGRPAWR
ncbi:MAG: hypothetical protein IPK81_22200 [Rhodospirillales bacterium]|nr:MAG: hypothetical protein IPK81_22200 [Rhodospirillales bacterium]